MNDFSSCDRRISQLFPTLLLVVDLRSAQGDRAQCYPWLGPAYPAPAGLSFSQCGTEGDETIGQSGGKTCYLTGATLTSTATGFFYHNPAPSISSIPDQAAQMATPIGPINFTFVAAETPCTLLALTRVRENSTDHKNVAIDPLTLTPTTVSSASRLTSPVGLVLEQSGNILVVQVQQIAVVRLSYPGGTQALTASGSSVNGAAGVPAYYTGEVVVASRNGASVIGVNPANGTQDVLVSGPPLPKPFGLAILRPAPPLVIAMIARYGFTPPGQFSMPLNGPPEAAVADPSLPSASWATVGQPARPPPGRFSFTDPLLPRPSQCYQRLCAP
jgi:hypothetical protein